MSLSALSLDHDTSLSPVIRVWSSSAAGAYCRTSPVSCREYCTASLSTVAYTRE